MPEFDPDVYWEPTCKHCEMAQGEVHYLGPDHFYLCWDCAKYCDAVEALWDALVNLEPVR